MNHHVIIVQAECDDEAGVWVARSSDIDGLAVEATTMEELTEKVKGAVVDLVELNGFKSSLPEIPVCVMASHLAKATNPHCN